MADHHVHILTILLVLCSAVCWADVGYQFHNIRADRSDRLFGVVFAINFSTPILVQNAALNDSINLTPNNQTQWCGSDDCVELPNIATVTADVVALQCKDKNVLFPLLVLPYWARKDSVRTLVSGDITPDNELDSIMAMFILEERFQNPSLVAEGIVSSGGETLNLNQCSILVAPDPVLTDASGQPLDVAFNISNIADNTCRKYQVYSLIEFVEAELAGVQNAKTTDQVQRHYTRILGALSSRVWASCALFIDGLYNVAQDVIPHEASQVCFLNPEDAGFDEDPCCNTKLLWETCCNDRPQNETIRSWISTNVLYAGHPKGFNIEECPIFIRNNGTDIIDEDDGQPSNQALKDYVYHKTNVDDTSFGCEATPKFTTEMIAYFREPFDNCLAKIYGDDFTGPSCKEDSDCITKCNLFLQTCELPLENATTYIVTCIMASVPTDLLNFYQYLLEVPPDSTPKIFTSLLDRYYSAEECLGPTGSGKNNSDACLEDGFCNWQDCQVSPTDCETACYDETLTDSFCGTCFHADHVCIDYTEREGCVAADVDDPDVCITLPGGKWVPLESRCYLTQLQSLDDCFPPQRCSQILNNVTTDVNWNRTRCEPYCYDETRAEADCVNTNCDQECCNPKGYCPDAAIRQCVCDIDAFCCDGWDEMCGEKAIADGCINCNCIRRAWDPVLNTCKVLTASKERCLDPYLAGGKWWDGRIWQSGRFATADRCAAGVCSLNEALGGETCTQSQGCTDDSCFICTAARKDPINLCTTNEDQAECVTPGAVWDTELGVCFYTNYTAENCTVAQICATNNPPKCAAGTLEIRFQSCSVLSTDECNSCDHGLSNCPLNQTVFRCVFAWTRCQTPELCDKTGRCSDVTVIDELGSCIYPFTITVDGIGACYDGLVWTRVGCLDPQIADPAQCIPPGYWKYPARTPEACEAWGTLCLEKRHYELFNYDELVYTQKPCPQCQACGGTCERAYEWTPSVWSDGAMQKSNWIPRTYASVNQWAKTVSIHQLSSIYEQALFLKFQEATLNDILCRIKTDMEVTQNLLEHCTASEGVNNLGRPTLMAQKSILAGIADVILAKPFKLTMNASTVPADAKAATFQVSHYSLFEFYANASVHGKRDGYMDVVFSDGFRVGQLVSDGLVIHFPDGAKIAPFEACIEIRQRPEHLWHTIHNTLDIAVLQDDLTLTTNFTEVRLEQNGTLACVDVYQSTTFFVAMRSYVPLYVALWTFVPAFAILMFLSGWRWITNLRNDETYFKPVKLTTHSFAIIMSAMRIVQCVLVNILKLQKQYPEDLYIWNIFDWPCWFMFIIVQVMYVRAMGMPTPKNILLRVWGGLCILLLGVSVALYVKLVQASLALGWTEDAVSHVVLYDRVFHWVIVGFGALSAIVLAIVNLCTKTSTSKIAVSIVTALTLLHYGHALYFTTANPYFGHQQMEIINSALLIAEQWLVCVFVALTLTSASKSINSDFEFTAFEAGDEDDAVTEEEFAHAGKFFVKYRGGSSAVEVDHSTDQEEEEE